MWYFELHQKSSTKCLNTTRWENASLVTSVTLTTFKSVDNDDVLKQLDGIENYFVENGKEKNLKKRKVLMSNLKT